MSDNAKIFWTMLIAGSVWIATLWAAVVFSGCSSAPTAPAALAGSYVRLQCFLPTGTVTAVIPMEKFHTRFQFENIPCIFEGIDQPPAPVASATSAPQPTATPERKRK